MSIERQPTASARAGSSSTQVSTGGSDRVGGPRRDKPAATKSAIRDIIRRYRETFDRLAR